MSALFKLVLGQKVVHPQSLAQNSGVEQEDAVDTNGRPGSPAPNVAEGGNGTIFTNAMPPMRSTPAASNGQRMEQAAQSQSPRDTTSSKKPRAAAAANAAPAPLQQAPASSLSPPLPASRPSTPTRTLLLRIEGCTVAQDIRDALRDLLRCPDLPYALDEPALKSLTGLLSSYAEDESITEPTLHLLVNATDGEAYPSQYENNRRTVEVTRSDKEHTCDKLLQSLVDAVPLLLGSMGPTAPFWSRYYVVLLLQRLEEYEPSKVNQALLAARGVGALLDALNDTEHDNALRNQALLLLTSLTLTDRELQTLLAFDNAFDSLFDLIQREGGVLGGGSVVRDSLTIVHNILRSNKATQKLFREMGCAARLAALFDSVPSELAACAAPPDHRRGSATPSPSHWPQPTVLTNQLEPLLEQRKTPDGMLNVLMAVSILSCVLRGAEDSEEERHATQDALLRCGLLSPLTHLAFCGLAIDDATRIEAVRALAMLLDRSKRTIEEWLSLPPLLTLTRVILPYTVRLWPAPRALLSYVCETTDTTLVSAGVQLFLAVLSVPACQERVLGVFLEGLTETPPAGGRASGGGNNNSANVRSPTASSNVGGAGASTSGQAQGNVSSDPQCGAALARLLFSPATSSVEKYYTAQVFRTLIDLPAAASTMSQRLIRTAVPTALQTSTLNALVKAQPGWALSTKLTPSFFNYYVSFLLFAVSGGAASQQMNTATLGAYVAALLAWMSTCPWAAASLVQETAWADALLYQARRDGAAHLRLWSAMLVARGCVVVQAATASARTSTAAGGAASLQQSATAAAGTALAQRFLQVVGGGAALDTILFDVQASTPAWQHPVTSGLRTLTPTAYDEPFVAQMEQLVLEFKQLLSQVAGASSARRTSLPLPPLTHLTPQQPQHQAPQPNASSPPLPPPPQRAPTALNGPPHAEPSPPPQQQQQQQQQQQHKPFSAASSVTSSGDFQVPSSVILSNAAAPSLTCVPTMTYAGAAASAESNAEAHAPLAAVEAELQAAREERSGLLEALEEWRTRAERSEAHCEELQRRWEERAAAMAAAEAEVAHQRDAVATAQLSAVSPEEVDGLRENVNLLEEALNSKDEEHQQLVDTLNMMEAQLQQATHAAEVANAKHAEAQSQLQALQRQVQAQRSANPAPVVSPRLSPPPPPPPPPPPHPSTEALAAMEADRAAMQERLAEKQQEAQRLQQALGVVTSDLNDLLMMVAELNEECLTVKANSSVALTPARQLGEDLSASPSLDRGDNMEAEVATGDAHVDGDVATVSLRHAPTRETAPWSAAEMDASAKDPFATFAHNASAAVDYADATDVLVDTASSPPAPWEPSFPPHSQQEAAQFPPVPSYNTVTPPPPSQQQRQQQPEQYQAQAPLPPPPPAAPHGGLPIPVLAYRPAHPHAVGRHAPRYADMSSAFFGGSAAPPAPSPPPPPSAPSSQPPQPLGTAVPPAYAPPTQMVSLPQHQPFHPPPHPPAPHSPPAAYHSITRADLVHSPPTPPHRSQEQHSNLEMEPFSEAYVGQRPEELAEVALPSADDFFGGGISQPHNKSDDHRHNDETLHGGSSLASRVASPPALSLEHISREVQSRSLSGAPKPPTAPSSPNQPMLVNPFNSRSVSQPNGRGPSQLSSAPVSKGHGAAAEELQTPKAEEAMSAPVESAEAHQPASTQATLPPVLPPPPHPHCQHHSMSALSGNAHHLNYMVHTTHAPQVAHYAKMTPVTSTIHPPTAHPTKQEEVWMEGHAVDHEERVEDAATAAASEPAAAPYNPFADLQGNDDEDDGFSDLR